MKNTQSAFHWIIDILENQKIRYKITGGLASRVYGVNRELADIDIEVSEFDINKISEKVHQYIIFGPARYRDSYWDLNLMIINYEGQVIDIAGTEAKIFNRITEQWELCSEGLEDVEPKEVFGRIVSVESKKSLIAYKTKLGREVDLEDIKQLLALNSKII